MQQGNTSTAANGRPTPAQATAFALRSLGQVVDMHMATTRVLMQAHARAASAFGWPDWSGLFDQVDHRARDVFAASAEQMVQATQRANDAAVELQQQMGRVVQSQAATMADNLQHSLQELGDQTGEGLRQLCDSARLQAEQAERVAQSVSQEFRETLSEGSAQARQALREGGRQMDEAARRGADQADDMVRQGGQQVREGAQRGAEALQRGGESLQRAGEMGSSAGINGGGENNSGENHAQPGGDERSGRRPKNPPQASAA
jgi:hypothetical protein